MANPNQNPAAGEQADEVQIEQALKRLKELHIQASLSVINSNETFVLTALSFSYETYARQYPE